MENELYKSVHICVASVDVYSQALKSSILFAFPFSFSFTYSTLRNCVSQYVGTEHRVFPEIL